MDDDEVIRTDIELALADACWRHEIVMQFGPSASDDDGTRLELKGEANTMLRSAYEERLRAIRAWRRARGIN
ncbi:hypothetical protein [Methylorubrum zatmanii]|uniref:Uncharacterized protein n=1 Tax=Methylorubrum zatmanii TaxID=29429 RepID=A0ABW1WRG7_9HYPH|nr:hypothetical protein [Methylorubrum zatmanii]MBD8906186.1 hypothetical protein [Methylorubrum zatmanii]